jgi:adenylate cyclase
MDTPAKPSFRAAIGRWFTLPQMRIWSGLILFAFAITHFINHSFGLVSLELMQSGQDVRLFFTRSLLGTAILIAAASVHFVLGIAKFLNVRTWRIGIRSIVQLIFGLLIPIFLIRHVIGTRGANALFGLEDSYTYALWAMWPGEALGQAILMTLVWVHGCIGIHHWLALRAWYRRSTWLWYALAVLIPALGYAGFTTASRARLVDSTYQNPLSSEQYTTILGVFQDAKTLYLFILIGAISIWVLLLIADRFARRIVVRYADGPEVFATRGLSILEVSRINRIPHASVCGSKARCSTCRVRIIDGLEHLPAASAEEIKVLKRVGAPSNVRLACQLRPTKNLTISTLLPANIDVAQGTMSDRYHWGVEKDVTILFCDLRGFTKMSEGKLSFDVVFLLNQFLGRMAEAIEDTGGYVDKFMGDGIMAIFGMETSAEDGAQKALAAARAMGGVLDSLNHSLRDELPVPLQVGIGVHTGLVVLGRIGAGHKTSAAATITALGESVNMASRLEGLTKELEVQVVVSRATIEASGYVVDGKFAQRMVDVRGFSHPVAVYAVGRAIELPSGS